MGEKVSQPEPVAPITTTVIKGTGDGAVIPSGTVATTPGASQPNVVLNFVSPVVAILVRFGYLFGTTLVGLLIAGMTPAGGKLLYTSDFYHLVITCSNLSLPVAVLGLLKDVVTVLGRLEGKWPLLTGSV